MLNSILSETPEFYEILILGIASLLGGVLFSFIYSLLKKKDGYFKDMILSFTLFPFIVTMAVIFVTLITDQYSGSALTARIGRVSVALLSAVLILRFRSEQRNFEDLTFMFLLTIFALGMGLGYIWLSFILYAISVLIFVVYNKLNFPKQDKNHLQVSITIPESLDYPTVFDDVLQNYCKEYSLMSVKTTDLGSVFIVKYNICLKENVSQKEFLDDLRTKNSNLNISLTMNDFKSYKK